MSFIVTVRRKKVVEGKAGMRWCIEARITASTREEGLRQVSQYLQDNPGYSVTITKERPVGGRPDAQERPA